LDWDRMVKNVTEPAVQERAETDCLVPGLTGSWTNGISRGWYDFYVSGLTDQYVDIEGLPDGVYELVASADPLGTLDELDETDNQSSLLIQISGDEVDVLEERGHFRVQDADDA
ncbi:MAG TPA: lysyl oxidase family protein, partial [Candidatus Thermoplasmatota archaeon]|nr:lysyl oxidase family protein [Candidatus Thermoplasmatota archaeon]